ncbi:Phosphoglucosamine mutase, partial [Dissostichus eleginoides]
NAHKRLAGCDVKIAGTLDGKWSILGIIERSDTKIRGKKLSVVVDETTDTRDCSVLNIVIGVENQYYLVDVIFMDRCNHSTVAQAIIRSFHSNNLDLNDVWAVVTDNASYCLKAYREILKGLMPNSVHVTCLCHVINLVGETWQHYRYFSDAASLVAAMRSVFCRKPARKRRWVSFLINKEFVHTKAPPESVGSRWNSWFEAVQYHAEHVHLYREFLLEENSSAQAVTNILSLLETEEKMQALTVKLTFIAEGCSKLMTALTILEGTHRTTAVSAYNIMEDLGSYLVNGTAKTCGFGAKTDELLRKTGVRERKQVLDDLHDAFHLAFTKFSKHWDTHPAREIYKLIRVFDPRQAPAMEKRMEAYTSLIPMANPSQELSEQWIAYQHSREPLAADVTLADYWRGMSVRFPKIVEMAMSYIYFPVSSVDCERSFSKYKTPYRQARGTHRAQHKEADHH